MTDVYTKTLFLGELKLTSIERQTVGSTHATHAPACSQAPTFGDVLAVFVTVLALGISEEAACKERRGGHSSVPETLAYNEVDQWRAVC